MVPESKTPSRLEPGSVGPDVVLLEQFLAALSGDYSFEPTGVFTESTALQVSDFKAGHDLTDDAIVDADTWMALFEAIGPGPADPMLAVSLDDYPALSQVLRFAEDADIEGYVAAGDVA